MSRAIIIFRHWFKNLIKFKKLRILFIWCHQFIKRLLEQDYTRTNISSTLLSHSSWPWPRAQSGEWLHRWPAIEREFIEIIKRYDHSPWQHLPCRWRSGSWRSWRVQSVRVLRPLRWMWGLVLKTWWVIATKQETQYRSFVNNITATCTLNLELLQFRRLPSPSLPSSACQ